MTEAGLKYTTRTGLEQNGVVDGRPGACEEYFYTGVSGSVVEVKHEVEEGGVVTTRLLNNCFEAVESFEDTLPGTTQELRPTGDDFLMIVHRTR